MKEVSIHTVSKDVIIIVLPISIKNLFESLLLSNCLFAKPHSFLLTSLKIHILLLKLLPSIKLKYSKIIVNFG